RQGRARGAAEMSACGFSYAHYRETLSAARVSHAFAAFDAPDTGAKPSLLLRHDVDFCPQAALRLATLEAELGVVSTYFVLPHGPYDVLGSAFAAIRAIVALGHRLGPHYDLSFYAAHGLSAAAMVQHDA